MKKECGACTKCCDGELGVPYPSTTKACLFLNNGCSIYEIRPDFPCKSFNCGWIRDKNMPEQLKPNKSNIVFYNRSNSGIKYLDVIEVGEISNESRDRVLQYSIDANVNIKWGNYKMGSEQFLSTNTNNVIDEAHNDVAEINE